ncbi:MAG TPA: amidohydrolase family protein [Acidimicrobiales bacterium]|nr:amidohydrolase family protein [Acidimicrobiales bacterium]
MEIRTKGDTLLPDPEPREVRYTIISVDDHLVEPPDMFEERLPARLADRAPRVVETAEGHQVWEFDGERYTQVGMNAVAGRRRDHVTLEPTRFEDMRRGCFDIDARIIDMDLNGVWASLNFPSQITGFSGRVFSQASDPELGLAVTRAFNDWLYEAWWQPYPDRIIPCGITYLTDPELGAAEIRRNAERGFRSVTLPERPHRLGMPSIFSGYWDPVIAACQDTGTVVSLHVGSSGMPDMPTDGPLLQLGATLFGQMSLTACAEWLWSGLPVRYPELQIAMSEGGIGWVAMLLDRLDNVVDRSGYGRDFGGRGSGASLRPADVLRRNFWFCTIDDPSTIDTRHAIGIDHVMVEVDYPHGDSTWPDTQEVIERAWGHLPLDDLRKLTHENAARLYRWPLPDDVRP